MTDVELYRPVEDDWQLVRDLRLRALADEPAAFLERFEVAQTFDEAEWRSRIRRNHQPGNRQLIARTDAGRWVGNVVVFTSQGQPGYLAGEEGGGAPRANIVGVWVDPEHRGADAGVADALLAAQCAWVRDELGLDRVFLHVGDWNARARRFYERNGFVATGVTEQLPGDLSDYEVELVLQFPPPAG